MAHLKQDKRILRDLLFTSILGIVGAFGLYRIFGVGAAIIAIVGILILFALRVAWLLNFYNCPACGRRLQSKPSGVEANGQIRHHCEACDTTWISPIAVGTSGDV